MLVLTVKPGEKVFFFLTDGTEIEVTYELKNRRPKFLINAPKAVGIAREAIADDMRRHHNYLRTS